MNLEFYPVIHPDGTLAKIHPKNDAGLYKEIVEHVGSPFDVAPMAPGRLMAYVHDTGIIDGLPLNVPILLATGFVFAGPVMLIGPADHEGETTLPMIDQSQWTFLETVCEVLKRGWAHLEEVRANPGPRIIEMTAENFDKFLSGEPIDD